VAEHVRPVSIDGDRLLVEVDEPGWATQLRFLQADVLERLYDVVGVRATALDVRVKKR
jgi:predicted nucleic acid-binding Zn ribbon protein